LTAYSKWDGRGEVIGLYKQ